MMSTTPLTQFLSLKNDKSARGAGVILIQWQEPQPVGQQTFCSRLHQILNTLTYMRAAARLYGTETTGTLTYMRAADRL